MTRRISLIVVLLIAIAVVCSTAYCFAEETFVLTKIDSIDSLDLSNIYALLSDDYLFSNQDEEVIVIAKYKDGVNSSITNDLNNAGIEATKRYSYSNVFNGESFKIKIKDIATLSQYSYIESVTLATQYYTLSDGLDMYSYTSDSNTNDGIFKNDSLLYQGEGQVICVIDAGFDTSHIAFSKIDTDISDQDLTISTINGVLTDLNSYKASYVTAQNLYQSQKIAYAYDYGDNDTNLYSTLTSHGTHVAGIAAGYSDDFSGVAKNAQLALMKVADSDGYMYNDTIAAALEDAYTLDVDVVNMSLGSIVSTFEEYEGDPIYTAVQKLEEKGVSVVCAAGNEHTSAYGGENESGLAYAENTDNSAISSPASYSSTISIANAEETRWATFDTDSILSYSRSYNTATSTYVDFSEAILNASLNSVEYVVLEKDGEILLGNKEDYEGYNVEGKIVVVKRGDITFEAKAQAAKEKGVVGIIFVNSSSALITPSLTTDIPSCIVTQDIGKELQASTTKTLHFDEDYVKTVIANSSSKGVTNNLTFGVDIAGYGTGIKSAINDQAFSEMTGTSMASPNVAGVMAVIRQYVEDNFTTSSKSEIASKALKLVMSNTTLLQDLNNVYISPRAQGAGLANIEKILSSKEYITTSFDGTKIELGDNLSQDLTLSFTIENYSSNTYTYTLSVKVLTELVKDNIMTGNDKELTFTINGVQKGTLVGDEYQIMVESNTTKDVEISLTLSQESLAYLTAQPYGEYVEGYIILNSSGSNLSCPFIGYYGSWDDVSMLDITAYEKDEDTKAYMRASTSYGIYAGAYYMPLGDFAFVLDEDYEGEKPKANEEFASLSIFSSSMYALGYIQLGLLRSADYVEIEVYDSITNALIYSESEENVSKGIYSPSYSRIIGGDLYVSISPYSLNLYNNEQYEVVVKVYRKYDENSEDNSYVTYSQKFYVDEESPEIENIETSEKDGKYYVELTLSDNHYIQALAVCTGTGSSISNVTLNVEDIYPIAIEPTSVGQTVKVKYDVTKAIENANNGYLYFYLADYAFNTNVYYYSVENWESASKPISNKSSDSQTTDSSRPQTDSSTVTNEISFKEDQLEVSQNVEVDLANAQYINNYSSQEKYTWSVSDSSILAISDGKITGLQAGMAVVTLKDESNSEAILIVQVKSSTYPSAEYKGTNISGYEMVSAINQDKTSFFGINISSSKIELAKDESFTLEFTYSPYNYNYVQNPVDIEIESLDPTIVKVINGVIEAKASGETTLNVYAKGTLIKSYQVTVAPEVYVNDSGILLACFKDESTIDLASYTNIIAVGENAFTYLNSVQNVILPNTVRVIYANAFKGNSAIQSITLGDNITTIGDNAFANCIALTSIDLKNVKNVGENVFSGCVNLDTVKISESALDYLNIYPSAFNGCVKLQNFTILPEVGDTYTTKNIVVQGELKLTLDYTAVLTDTSITRLGSGAFSNAKYTTIDLTSTSIEEIASKAFYGNSYVKTIKLPSTIKVIGASAFENCTRLATFTIAKTDNQELTIGNRAFYNTALQLVDFSNMTTQYGDYVFAMCQNLNYVSLGVVEKMGEYTFAASSKVFQVNYEEGSKTTGTYTFAPITISSKTYYHNALRGVTIPASIETIDEYAFAYCYALRLDKGALKHIKEIKDYAFLDCTSLVELELDNIESLGYAAFAESSLQKVVLNKDMTAGTLQIGELAFYECDFLKTVILPTNENISVEILKGAFYHCSKLESAENGVGINVDRVTKLGDYAFTQDTSLTQLWFPVCTEVGYAAFADCEKLEMIEFDAAETIGDAAFYSTKITVFVIPSTIKSIGQAAFTNTEVEISLDGESENIIMDGSIVYQVLSDGTYMLVYYPKSTEGTTYTVLDGTSCIGEYAFEGNKNLVSVILPASITTISHGAFYNCTSLGTIIYKGNTIPKLLASYASSTKLYCNFMGYDQDNVSVAIYVQNADVKELLEGNKTWATLCDYIIVGNENNNVTKLLAMFKSLDGKELNSENKKTFAQAMKMYNNLSDEEQDIFNSLTASANVMQSIEKFADDYESQSIIDNISNTTGLDKWVIILIIVLTFTAIVGGAGAIFFYVSKRKMAVANVVSSSQEAKDIEDIFGTRKKEEPIKEEDVFEETKINVSENNEGNLDDNDQKPMS